MYMTHEFDSSDRCIHCCCSRVSVIINNWNCNLLNPPEVPIQRLEIAHDFSSLVKFIESVPAIVLDIGTSSHIDNNWYIYLVIF